MVVLRSEIERALDEVISNEEGMRFQGIAVVLAKEKWPDLIASERKKDVGIDAYASAVLARDHEGRVLACSLTAEITKIKSDLDKFKKLIPSLKVLIFSTPRKVTEEAKEKWATTILRDYNIDLIIVSREDIITDLMKPDNASVCASMLGIAIRPGPTVDDLTRKAMAAASEVITAWLSHPRLAGRPRINLIGSRLDSKGLETNELITISDLESALFEGQRIILEGAAGEGKTTTLIQLADRSRHTDRQDLCFLIDLPEFLRAGDDAFDFIARMPPFLSRGVTTSDLALLYANTHCSFLLNGWNEISDNYSEDAVRALTQLERNFPAAGIILATRGHRIQPPLPASVRVKLRPISRSQRTEYLRESLTHRASELIAELDSDPALDDLTRTPLVLAEVATLFQAGKPIPKTKMAVLEAVVQLIEESDEHRHHLDGPNLSGNSRDYLIELAKYSASEGEVSLIDAKARAAVYSVSARLQLTHQIVHLPQPADVLNTLCAHHLLQRVNYPVVAFKFQHQQFQEFFATTALQRELSPVTANSDPSAIRSFARNFINIPAWEEPLRMLAEDIGRAIGEGSPSDDLPAAKQLIMQALEIDPIFAAELSRLCGRNVWLEVRQSVADRLRLWLSDLDQNHRQCALAGMIASGSSDFSDIILPLLTSNDQQTRLRSYRAWSQFHMSTLGPEWRQLIATWDEDARLDFVGEVGRTRESAHITQELALSDPSHAVRVAAIHALFWVGAVERLQHVLDTLDDAAFRDMLQTGTLDRLPIELRARALSACRVLLDKTQAPLARIRLLLAARELGEETAIEDIQKELSLTTSVGVRYEEQGFLKSVFELVRQVDSQWLSNWLVDRIIDGSLSGSYWITFISSISDTQRDRLVHDISGRELSPIESHRLISLAAVADFDLCGSLFLRACAIRSDLSASSPQNERSKLNTIVRQIEDFIRAAPSRVALTGIAHHLSTEVLPHQYRALANTFGSVGLEAIETFDLRAELDDNVQLRLRAYLTAGARYVLTQEDYSGDRKAHAAIALAILGDAEDIDILRQLIRSDIERRRTGLAARLKGDRGPLGNGAVMSYFNWHVTAVVGLRSKEAESLLIELLREPEYEQDAARGLLQLARQGAAKPQYAAPFRARDYAAVWAARETTQPIQFDENRRQHFSDALRHVILAIIEGGKTSTDSTRFNFRAKKLATILAMLDAKNSSDFILEVLALPSKWNEWDQAGAVESLVFNGARLAAQQTLAVLEPVIEHTTRRGFYDQQQRYLLQKCLCTLAFLDKPELGIARIREILADKPIHSFELREVIPALGQSRCVDALSLLLELGRKSQTALQGVALQWIDVIAALDTTESDHALLGFVDPDIPNSGIQHRLEHHEVERLALHIADIARTDKDVKDRLYSLCTRSLDGQRGSFLCKCSPR
jgi:hypothetical protein